MKLISKILLVLGSMLVVLNIFNVVSNPSQMFQSGITDKVDYFAYIIGYNLCVLVVIILIIIVLMRELKRKVHS